ncbi:sirohydrochlorin chelatase [Saccharopolyspora gloriosae]|uniref:Sirohydrochlorin ferrochelatase n=1 Tax=Saccharopolyspora gloriosae TaxID=455344 RepID=A0A840NI54_9PSEU|nr:CbiX/SirB N-terminal domain-containing protein [Saccharopolyspora gloriosae]MBB5069715.1 sirohydrochlorin ferrochelatase [Saccharopolyspora gloriosae]
MTAPLLLVAHGTRDPAGPRVLDRIAAAVADRAAVAVRVAYVDVIGPTVADALRGLGGPVVAVPAFLAAGYHVRTDLPTQLAAAGRTGDVTTTAPIGPAPELAAAMLDRLAAAGWHPGAEVVFAAAGSSDPRALADVRAAASLLGRRCGRALRPSYVSTATPLTERVCAAPPTADRIIAPYLLAPGLFHRKLSGLPVEAVAEPIGAHPRVVDLVVRRYREALADSSTAWISAAAARKSHSR